MHRRDFLRTAGVCGGAALASSSGRAALGSTPKAPATPAENDEEYFRVAQVDRKWFVLDPSGRPQYLRGLNHYGNGQHMPLNLEERYGTREKWLASVRDRHREWGFNYLPPSVGPSESTARVVTPERNDRGGPRWKTPIHRTPALGASEFSTLDYPFVAYLDVPRQYMAGRGLPDVFSDEFARLVDARCRELCAPLAKNRNLIGYHFVHNPPWDPSNRSFDSWIVDTVRDGSPAHREWTHLMLCIYGTVQRWRRTYGLPIKSFDEILRLPFPLRGYVNEKRAQEDRLAFMQRVCTRWFEVFRDSIRRYDPHHLILGDRNSIHLHPLPAYAIQTMGRFVDVLSVNTMGPAETFFETLESVTRHWSGPILLADTGAGIYQGSYPKSAYMCRDLREYDALYESYMTAGLEHPQLVGFGWCGYYETPSHRSGIVDSRTDDPLADRVAVMKKWNDWMAERHRELFAKKGGSE